MDTAWLIAEPEVYHEYDLGSLKTGKEAEVFLVERVAGDGRSCLLAHKRYRPREVAHKGELQELGFQRASTFVNDRVYRDGRTLGNSRDRRAAAKKSRHGKLLLRQDWPDNEFAMLERLTDAGVAVPFPVARTADGVLMQYIGDRTMAAPRLVHAGLSRARRRGRGCRTRGESAPHGRSRHRARGLVRVQPALVAGTPLDHRRPAGGRHHRQRAGARLPAPRPCERCGLVPREGRPVRRGSAVQRARGRGVRNAFRRASRAQRTAGTRSACCT